MRGPIMRAVAFALAGVLVLSACDSDTTGLLTGDWITLLTEGDQVIEAGQSVTLSLRIRDEHEKPVVGARVLWRTEGAGSVDASSVTSAEGIASTRLTAGAGANRVIGRQPESQREALFTVHGCVRCG